MEGRFYRFLKSVIYLMFILSCITICIGVVYTIYLLVGRDGLSVVEIVNKIFSITVLLVGTVILKLFLNLLNEIEKGIFSSKSINVSKVIGKLFLLAAVLVIIPSNLHIDSSGLDLLAMNSDGFSIIGINIGFLAVVLLFNYLVFSIIPYLIQKVIEITEENKYII